MRMVKSTDSIIAFVDNYRFGGSGVTHSRICVSEVANLVAMACGSRDVQLCRAAPSPFDMSTRVARAFSVRAIGLTRLRDLLADDPELLQGWRS